MPSQRVTAFVAVAWLATLVPPSPAQPQKKPAPPRTPGPTTYQLDDLVALGLAQHPRLAQGALAVTAAQERAYQSGLYPNPTVTATFDELGDRTGPRGINTLPLVTQEIVTARKLTLNRAVFGKDADLATLALAGQRAAILGAIRASYFDALALQRRVEILADLVRIADQSLAQSTKLYDAKQVARLDLVQLELEAERIKAEQDATGQEYPAAFRRLAAVAGVPSLSAAPLTGSLDRPLPDYELDRLQSVVPVVHPDRRSAEVGIERARLALRRAEVEAVPNVTVSAGYVRQNQNKSNDWMIGASVPLPIWNRNQGGVRAAQAQLGEASLEVVRVEADLTERLAATFRDFVTAKTRADRYRTKVLPLAKQSYDLSLEAFKGGQFEYLRVLESQRALTQANLEYVKALGDAWKAASLLSGLTLEEQWPPVTTNNRVTPPDKK